MQRLSEELVIFAVSADFPRCFNANNRIMKHKTLILRLIAAICLIAGPLTAGAQIFYKVTGNGLKAPAYLFGTHHLAPNSMVDSVPGVRDALAQADNLIVEVVMTNPVEMAGKLQKYMFAPADSTLSSFFSADEFARMDSVCGTIAPGVSLKMFNAMKPMAVNSALTMMLVAKDLAETGQLDSWFMTEAKNEGKELTGLETPEFQAELLFNSVPLQRQAEMLKEMLDDPEETVSRMKELNRAYMAQDAPALLALSEEEDDAEFTDALLRKRNDNWMKVLPGLFDESKSFVAVGLLHLLGDEGLVKRLRDLGYTVEALAADPERH